LGFSINKESYAGSIKEISIGKGEKAVTVGGETSYPFYFFEGDMPNKPKVAMEIWDIKPDEWPESVLCHFKDVVSDVAAWAKKCINEYGAESIVLQLKSIDPNGDDASPEQAAKTVKKVLSAIDVPLILWGCANPEKDEAVFKKISEECQGESLTIGPVEDKNYKGIGASAMGYGHTLISSSPIDVNLAKQVNILLENLGVPMNKIIVDPTTGGLGYGLEYSYSVMERLRMAAMAQGDDKLQFPIINNIGNEVWKCKEAKQKEDEAPTLGDSEKRGILMEAVCAVTYLMAGSDILIMRHPEAIRMVKAFIDLAVDGGMALDIASVSKKLDDVDIDYAALAPAPDLSMEKEKAVAPEAKKAAPKEAAPKKEEPKKAAPKKAALKKVEPKAAEKAEAPKADAKAEVEAKAKIDAEAKIRADAEAKARAEAETKARADAEAKAKANAESEKKAAADKVKTKREAEEEAIRQKRAQEREVLAAKKTHAKTEGTSLTPAQIQKTGLEKIIDTLNWVHKRA
jgi:acetyl-CoA decarbonylase/synthase complex subunit delta